MNRDLTKPSVRTWFVVYVVMLVGAVFAIWQWGSVGAFPRSIHELEALVASSPAGLKLAIFGAYLSVCTTFTPLPTGGVVAALSAREAAVGSGVWETAALVAVVGAAGSTVANLNDYHLFVWVGRSRAADRIKKTRTYELAARWFSSAPFFITFVFNILPLPVDVARVLAALSRYPRLPFALANLIGRLLRYGIIAWLTYALDLGWTAAGVLLGLGLFLGAVKAAPALLRRQAAPS